MSPTPDDYDIAVRALVAVLCGGVLGIERDLHRIPTGFRTLALVSLGSCVAIAAALRSGDAGGFSRVAQGIVTGIGFLGAGVIVKTTDLHKVKGLTTAAAIWLTATIGILCGLGALAAAVLITVLAFSLLLADIIWRRLAGPLEDERVPDKGGGHDPSGGHQGRPDKD